MKLSLCFQKSKLLGPFLLSWALFGGNRETHFCGSILEHCDMVVASLYISSDMVGRKIKFHEKNTPQKTGVVSGSAKVEHTFYQE